MGKSIVRLIKYDYPPRPKVCCAFCLWELFLFVWKLINSFTFVFDSKNANFRTFFCVCDF